jgi:KDO2-lipid IV(A) lauroyltransferase
MMNGHELKKRINDFVGWLVLRPLYTIIPHLPLSISYKIAEKLGLFAYLILFPYRKRVIENLRIAFGKEKTDDEFKAIAREMSIHLIKGAIELLYSCSPSMEKIFERVRVVGKENLDAALTNKKGVIAISSHLGNFTLLGRRLERDDYPFYTLRKDPKGPLLTRFYRNLEKIYGGKFIYVEPWKECLRTMMGCLRDNGIVCFIPDENKRHGGVKVDFFGQKASTAIGPAILALRTGASVVPVFIIRERDDTHTIIIEPELHSELSGDQDKDVYQLTSAFTRIIESYVRQYPAQWPWISNRWKEKPPRKRVRTKRRDLIIETLNEKDSSEAS